MAVSQIPNLTPVVFLSPTAQIEVVQDGVTYRASAEQISAVSGGGGGGGGSLSILNDITSNVNYYPIFLRQTSGAASRVYTSDPNYLFNPQDGLLSAFYVKSSQGIQLNNSTVSRSYTLPTGDNGLSAGPVTVTPGTIITVNPGSVWTVV